MSSLDQYNALYINQLRLSSPTRKSVKTLHFIAFRFTPN